MKRTSNRRWTKTTGLLFGAILWLSNTSAVRADDSAHLLGRVISLVGHARCDTNRMNGRGTWHVLRVGDELRAGSLIQTGAKDSTVDIQLNGAGEGSQGTVRVFSNSALNLIKLNSREAGAIKVTDIKLGLASGKVLVTLDSISECDIELIGGKNPMRLAKHRRGADREETVFVFSLPGAVTVLKGALNVRTTSEQEKLVNSGEQLHSDTGEVTKAPLDAPELKLGP